MDGIRAFPVAIQPCRPIKTYVVTPVQSSHPISLHPTVPKPPSRNVVQAEQMRVLTAAEEKSERLRLSRQKSARNWRNKQKAKQLEKTRLEQAARTIDTESGQVSDDDSVSVKMEHDLTPPKQISGDQESHATAPSVVEDCVKSFSSRFLQQLQNDTNPGHGVNNYAPATITRPVAPTISSLVPAMPNQIPAIPVTAATTSPTTAEERRYLKNKRQRMRYANHRAAASILCDSASSPLRPDSQTPRHPFPHSYPPIFPRPGFPPILLTSPHPPTFLSVGQQRQQIQQPPASSSDNDVQIFHEESSNGPNGKRRHDAETSGQREDRLKVIRERARERRRHETPEQRHRRWAADLASHAKRRRLLQSQETASTPGLSWSDEMSDSSSSFTSQADHEQSHQTILPDIYRAATSVSLRPTLPLASNLNPRPLLPLVPTQFMLPHVRPSFPSSFCPVLAPNGMPNFTARMPGYPTYRYPFHRNPLIQIIPPPGQLSGATCSIRVIPVNLPPPPQRPTLNKLQVDANFSRKIALALEEMGSCVIVGEDVNHFPIILPNSRANSTTPTSPSTTSSVGLLNDQQIRCSTDTPSTCNNQSDEQKDDQRYSPLDDNERFPEFFISSQDDDKEDSSGMVGAGDVDGGEYAEMTDQVFSEDGIDDHLDDICGVPLDGGEEEAEEEEESDARSVSRKRLRDPEIATDCQSRRKQSRPRKMAITTDSEVDLPTEPQL